MIVNNRDFWDDVDDIINNHFCPKGIEKLDYYADLIISGKCSFKRFSPQEQHGCTAGGASHVVASILSGAEVKPDPADEKLSHIKRELKLAAQQVEIIERWARRVGGTKTGWD